MCAGVIFVCGSVRLVCGKIILVCGEIPIARVSICFVCVGIEQLKTIFKNVPPVINKLTKMKNITLSTLLLDIFLIQLKSIIKFYDNKKNIIIEKIKVNRFKVLITKR